METTNIEHPAISPRVALTFAILAVSTASIFIRFAQEQVPSLVIATYRLFLASLCLTPFALGGSRKEIASIKGNRIGLAALSGLLLALHFATWITSLEYTTVASSVVLVTTTPLWVALFSPIFLKEKLTRPVIIGLLIALMGSAVITMSDSCIIGANGIICPSMAQVLSGRAFIGDLLALCGALCAAGYMMIGRKLRPSLSIVPYTFVVYGISALVLIVLTLSTGRSLIGYPPINYVWFLALALIPQLIGHSIYNWSLKYISAAFVSITLLGEPVGSTILAYILLHETPGLVKLAGGVLILGGIYTASRWG